MTTRPSTICVPKMMRVHRLKWDRAGGTTKMSDSGISPTRLAADTASPSRKARQAWVTEAATSRSSSGRSSTAFGGLQARSLASASPQCASTVPSIRKSTLEVRGLMEKVFKTTIDLKKPGRTGGRRSRIPWGSHRYPDMSHREPRNRAKCIRSVRFNGAANCMGSAPNRTVNKPCRARKNRL